MANLTKEYEFTPETDAVASEVNTNFDDIINFINNSVVHVDGTKSMTAHLVLPSSDPTSDNQAARKKYVDDKVSSSVSAAVNGKFRAGSKTGTVNSAGDISFAHGLGATPKSVVLQPFRSNSTNHQWTAVVENWDATNVNVRIYNTTNGNALSSGSVTFYWMAFT